MTPPISLGDVASILRAVDGKRPQPVSVGILKFLDETLEVARADDNELDAKRIWCLREALLAQDMYVRAFDELKLRKHYEAWCNLELAELALGNLKRHIPSEDWVDFRLGYIEQQVDRLQRLFPYSVFLSSEIVIRAKDCSICGERVSLRSPCGHRVGEVYGGKLCHRIVTDMDVVCIALVRDPTNKYAVAFATDTNTGDRVDLYDYTVVDFAIDRLVSPFHEWGFEWTKRRHPHERYEHIPHGDSCPCGESDLSYRECCLGTEGVLRPHLEFWWSVPPPADLPQKSYSGGALFKSPGNLTFDRGNKGGPSGET